MRRDSPPNDQKEMPKCDVSSQISDQNCVLFNFTLLKRTELEGISSLLFKRFAIHHNGSLNQQRCNLMQLKDFL